jgi:DME family drug/metabolite transporter
MEPLTATVLGVTLFGERLSAIAVLGVALLACAVVLLLGPFSRRPRTPEAAAR